MEGEPGFRDHVRFRDAEVCRICEQRTCVEMCSGQAITPDGNGLPVYERKKCVHCGACVWNCPEMDEEEQANLVLGAEAGGWPSVED